MLLTTMGDLKVELERTDELYITLGQLVRAARRRAQLTQDVVAGRIGLTRTSINNIEHGRQKILVHTLYDLASALGVSPAALMPPLVHDQQLAEEELPADLEPAEQAWVRAVLAVEPETTT